MYPYRSVQPSRQTGPLAFSVREALGAVLSATAVSKTLDDALASAGLDRIPEEVAAFRRFCEHHLRPAVQLRLPAGSQEIFFDRLAHLVWTATQDLGALAEVRAWAYAAPLPDESSGVRTRDDPRYRSTAPPPPLSDPRRSPGPSRAQAAPTLPGTSRRPASRPRPPKPPMPSGVLVISCDEVLVTTLREELRGLCPVRGVLSRLELERALCTAGAAPVLLLDAFLPSIELAQFAALAGWLPPEVRVVAWRLGPERHRELVARVPGAAGWRLETGAGSPARALRSLGG